MRGTADELASAALSTRYGTGRIRTCNQGIMHPTSAFAAPFGFVVRTIPSGGGSACLPSGLYTF